jgi:hypothetical protein
VELLLVAVRLVIVAFVVVELPTMRLVIEAKVATSEEMKELVEVALDAMRLVVDAFTIVAFVVVELPTMRLVMEAKVATREEMKELVLVLLVVEAFVAAKLLVTVAFVVVRLAMVPVVEKSVFAVSAVADAVVRVVCPPTTRLPEAERLVVDALERVD